MRFYFGRPVAFANVLHQCTGIGISVDVIDFINYQIIVTICLVATDHLRRLIFSTNWSKFKFSCK